VPVFGPSRLVGVGLQTRTAGVPVVLGIYSEQDGGPYQLLASTGELLTTVGRTEGPVDAQSVGATTLWVAVSVGMGDAGRLSVATEPADAAKTQVTWLRYAWPYNGVLPSTPPAGASPKRAQLGWGDMYIIATKP
jgi:hypothetical protein